jgi:hypothetical protein
VPKKAKRLAAQEIENDFRYPPFYNLPRRFWDKLNAASEEFAIPRRKLMMRGLDLAIKELKQESAPSAPVSDKTVSQALKKIAEMRWQRLSAEERRTLAKKMAAARWGKKRTNPDE